MGLGTLLAMAINVVAIVVCLFLIAQYLEGTLHKGVRLGGKYHKIPAFNLFLSAASAHGDGTNYWQRLLASTGRLGTTEKSMFAEGWITCINESGPILWLNVDVRCSLQRDQRAELHVLSLAWQECFPWRRKFSHTRYRVWALILHITSTVILIAVYVAYIMVAALMQEFTCGRTTSTNSPTLYLSLWVFIVYDCMTVIYPYWYYWHYWDILGRLIAIKRQDWTCSICFKCFPTWKYSVVCFPAWKYSVVWVY